MNDIGHNRPPTMVTTAAEVTQDLGSYLAENPVIETAEQAKAAKVHLDRGKLCVADMETERIAQVKPLNQQVDAINSKYRGPKQLLQRVVDELRGRLDHFIKAEERRRQQVAAEAERQRQAAEQAAREAERIEQDALERADVGELGIDVAGVAGAADQAFADYQKAERQAAIAERETHVKVTGGFTRALSLRSVETLYVINWRNAMEELGLTEHIHEAILKSARAYKKLKGRYPSGIEASIERKS